MNILRTIPVVSTVALLACGSAAEFGQGGHPGDFAFHQESSVPLGRYEGTVNFESQGLEVFPSHSLSHLAQVLPLSTADKSYLAALVQVGPIQLDPASWRTNVLDLGDCGVVLDAAQVYNATEKPINDLELVFYQFTDTSVTMGYGATKDQKKTATWVVDFQNISPTSYQTRPVNLVSSSCTNYKFKFTAQGTQGEKSSPLTISHTTPASNQITYNQGEDLLLTIFGEGFSEEDRVFLGQKEDWLEFTQLTFYNCEGCERDETTQSEYVVVTVRDELKDQSGFFKVESSDGRDSAIGPWVEPPQRLLSHAKVEAGKETTATMFWYTCDASQHACTEDWAGCMSTIDDAEQIFNAQMLSDGFTDFQMKYLSYNSANMNIGIYLDANHNQILDKGDLLKHLPGQLVRDGYTEDLGEITFTREVKGTCGSPQTCAYAYGDVNRDGFVDALDETCVQNSIANGGNPNGVLGCRGVGFTAVDIAGVASQDNLPCGGDGVIDLNDRVAVQQAILGEPYCDCGDYKPCVFQYGDVNHDGSVDDDDVTCVADFFLSSPSCKGAEFNDVDLFPCGGNGIVDYDDVLAAADANEGNPHCPCGHACDFEFGDVNRDGSVDLLDRDCTLNVIGGIYDDPSCLGAPAGNADVYPCGGDGMVVDVNDLLWVLDALGGIKHCPCGNAVSDAPCQYAFGDINHDHVIDDDDIHCVLEAFGDDFSGHCNNVPFKAVDIAAATYDEEGNRTSLEFCSGGDGIINLEDILAVERATMGELPPCACNP